MKFARKKYGWIVILCFVIMLSWTLSASANNLRRASITILYHGVTPQEESIALSGAEFVLHKVAVYGENNWNYEGAFADCDISLDDMSASGQLEAAKKMQEYVKLHQIQGKAQTTSQDGFLTFTELEEGLYLIVPSGEVNCGGGVFRSEAFLVQVPEVDEQGNQVYEIKIEPKNEWVSDDKESEEKPEQKPEQKPEGSPSKGENAKTGDDTPVELLVKILAASVIVIILLVFWRNHDKKDEEQLKE